MEIQNHEKEEDSNMPALKIDIHAVCDWARKLALRLLGAMTKSKPEWFGPVFWEENES